MIGSLLTDKQKVVLCRVTMCKNLVFMHKYPEDCWKLYYDLWDQMKKEFPRHFEDKQYHVLLYCVPASFYFHPYETPLNDCRYDELKRRIEKLTKKDLTEQDKTDV